MILQTNPRLNDKINVYGCYFMSLLWFANKYTNSEMRVERIRNTLYPKFIDNRWMDEDCYIIHPDKILEYFGLDVAYLGKKPADFVCDSHEIEVLHWKYDPRAWSHFVAGNGTGVVTYDPWGVSVTATEGYLSSKRVFRIENIRRAS